MHHFLFNKINAIPFAVPSYGAVILAVVLLAGPGSSVYGADEPGIQEVVPEAPVAAPAPLRPRFEGAWQKDFSRSDQWDDELNRVIDQMNRDAQRQSQGSSTGVSIGGRSIRRRGGSSVVVLAQLAEYISRQTTIRIRQSAVEVRIERDGDADLVCSTLGNYNETFTSEYGYEECGWDAHQLIFRIMLPEGVEILHRFSVSGDREELNMATSISNGGMPFNLRQFFWRYEAPSENYNCIETLSRGNSCSLTDFQRGR